MIIDVQFWLITYFAIGLVTACSYRYFTKRQANLVKWLDRILLWQLPLIKLIMTLLENIKRRLERISF